MMQYQIVLSKLVRQQLQNLPGHIKPIAKRAIANLGEQPRPEQAKELVGHPNFYRLWLTAKFRLVWNVRDEEGVVEIEYVGPKAPELYAYLGLGRSENER